MPLASCRPSGTRRSVPHPNLSRFGTLLAARRDTGSEQLTDDPHFLARRFTTQSTILAQVTSLGNAGKLDMASGTGQLDALTSAASLLLSHAPLELYR